MTPPKDGKLLWHLTPLTNLESIFQNGLLSRKKLAEMKEDFIDIADHEILDCRSKFGLEHYIPFHFMQKTPFAGIVMKKNSDEEFVYLTLHRATARSNNFKIITKHPLNEGAEFYNNYDEGMVAINWELMEDANRNYAIHEVKETCMAECVCHFEEIHISNFHCIYTKNKAVEEVVKSLASQYGVEIHISVNEKLFV